MLLLCSFFTTAAHCNFNLTESYVGPEQVYRTIVWGTVHPYFMELVSNTSAYVDFDFMVLLLDSPVPNDIPILQLNRQDDQPTTGSQLQVIGLGLTSENGEPSNVLQEVTLDYIKTSDCNDLYDGIISDSMLYVAMHNSHH